jgi:hypothetical protein
MSRDMLLYVFSSLGVEGYFLWFLQAIYANDIICINHLNEGVTNSFRC